MKHPGIVLLCIVAVMLAAAGCTKPSGPSAGASAVTVVTPDQTDQQVSDPAASPAPTAAPEATGTPAATNTSRVHYISQVRDIKDTQHLFSVQVPVEWRGIQTYQIDNPENYMGTMFKTDLLPNNTFSIITFSNYQSREQNYRDDCQRWIPAPNATRVTINGLTFDRYESAARGITNVTYVLRLSSMNDYGFLSVISFSADTSANPFAVEDYDRVVQSFRYYPKDQASLMSGTEIPFMYPDETSGNMHSFVLSSSSATTSTSKCHRSAGI